MLGYPILRASREAWLRLRDDPSKQKQPLNPGLIFDRFVRQSWDTNQDKAKRTGREAEKDTKREAWREIENAAKRADRELLARWKERWQATVAAAHAEVFPLTTDWRLVAGLGRKGPLEVGFTFHRYGFPILPGSSVKGIARAYAALAEGRDESDQDFLTIFGRAPQKGEDESMAQSGGAVFFDAVPSRIPALELDIMNPHYPKYYQGEEPPSDWQSPVPVYFLTVAAGSEFLFAVGWRGPWNEEARRLRDLAREWLIGGLTQLGAGAKTSAGYGYFRQPPTPTAPPATASPKAVSTPAPAQPAGAAPAATHTATGTVRYEAGKPFIRDESGRRWPINWKELGITNLKEKTVVEFDYQEYPNGQRKVIKVRRKQP